MLAQVDALSAGKTALEAEPSRPAEYRYAPRRDARSARAELDLAGRFDLTFDDDQGCQATHRTDRP